MRHKRNVQIVFVLVIYPQRVRHAVVAAKVACVQVYRFNRCEHSLAKLHSRAMYETRTRGSHAAHTQLMRENVLTACALAAWRCDGAVWLRYDITTSLRL